MNPWLIVGFLAVLITTGLTAGLEGWSLRGDHDEAIWAKKEKALKQEVDKKQDWADTMAYKYEVAKAAADSLNESFDKRLKRELEKPVFSNPACTLDDDSLQLLLQNIRGTASELPREPAGKMSTTIGAQ